MICKHYVERCIGLVLSEQEAYEMAKYMGYDDLSEFIYLEDGWKLYEKSEGQISFFPFTFTRRSPFKEMPDTLLVIKAKRQPSPFEVAYKDLEELWEEFRTLKKDGEYISEYMPLDFDWDAHIGEFSFSVLA